MQNGSQMRFSNEELDMIRGTFADNEPLLKLLRKVFLPEIDPNAPIGQLIDLWMTVDIKDKSAEDAITNLRARNELISFVDQRLLELSIMAQQAPLTEEQVKEKNKKDSVK